MLYGYGSDRAVFIQDALQKILGREIAIIGASGREDHTVKEIIEGSSPGRHEDGDIHILMFLGFSDTETSRAIDHFPRRDDIVLPIFCGLTEENYRWELSYLLEHLAEEHTRWMERSRRNEK